MNIEIKNITFSSASVSWSPTHYVCPEKFYRIMYRPNWNSILSGFSRQTFHREEVIPLSRNSFTLQRLAPSTNYILCVTCHGIHPSRDQCTIFHTMAKDSLFMANKKLDLAMIIWLTSSVFLIIIAITLMYGCLKMWCKKCKRIPKDYSFSSSLGTDRGATQAWNGADAETALVDDNFEVPVLDRLAVLDRHSESKSDGIIQKTLGGTQDLLSYKKDSDRIAILSQSVYE
ncbi:fibronectin type III domain-containing protein 9-like [Protopterus annectens]|uniref:fibronectin type III domain-containing protein 9-like n=1 Tax=Protopterus annectens TaxID=7888 RepID=UPI001CF999F3|nr:fibronectin type III domain-containing protein 9-like [Protopterus annectens]